MEWVNGKPGGTLFKRKNGKAYIVNMKNLETCKNESKLFSFSKYETPEEAFKTAKDYQIKRSKELNLTKNMYRVLEDGSFEVHIKDNITMLIDEQDIHLVDERTICLTRSSSPTSKYYAIFSNKGTREDRKRGLQGVELVHKAITGFDMTDHINRNTLDNRRRNLRETTPKMNNNNKSHCHKQTGVLGVRFVEKDNSWQARIKQDDKEYSKYFSVKRYGYEEAYNLAVSYRKELNMRFNSLNGEDMSGNMIEKN